MQQENIKTLQFIISIIIFVKKPLYKLDVNNII